MRRAFMAISYRWKRSVPGVVPFPSDESRSRRPRGMGPRWAFGEPSVAAQRESRDNRSRSSCVPTHSRLPTALSNAGTALAGSQRFRTAR